MKLRTVISTIIWCITAISQLNGIESDCGKRLVQHRPLILGGKEAHKNSWPWHAALFHVDDGSDMAYKCGGTVLNSNSILTAAHCVHRNNEKIAPGNVLVHVGRHELKVFESSAQEFEVTDAVFPSSKTIFNFFSPYKTGVQHIGTSAVQRIGVQP